MKLVMLLISLLAPSVAMAYPQGYGGTRTVCPSFIPNCECSTMARGVIVSCRNFVDRNQLTSTLHDLRGYSLHHFTMINFSLVLENGDFSDVKLYNMNVESSNLSVRSLQSGFLLETYNTLRALKFQNSILNFRETISAEIELSMLWFNRCQFQDHREDWFSGLSVEWLRIEDSKQMTQFAASQLRKLTKYSHVRSDLTTLNRSMLPVNATSITELDFSFNLITTLSDDFLSGLTSLDKLDLSNNKLETLNQTTFQNFNGSLVLSNNPLKCSPNLFWLTKQLQEKPLLHPYRLTCYTEDGRRKGIQDLNTTDSSDNNNSTTLA